jgi:hypothetical protein
MTGPLAGLPAPAQLHLLLLRAAGRITDAELTDLRLRLAEGRFGECAARLAGRFPMTADEIDVLRACAPPGTPMPRPADGPVDAAPGTPFIAVPPATLQLAGEVIPPLLDVTGDAEATDAYDAVVLEALDLKETVGVWRCWRISVDAAGNASAARIYVVEIDVAPADLPLITADVQRALLDAGDRISQIEVYRPGLPLPSYQWAARAHAALIWASYPTPDIRFAVDRPTGTEERLSPDEQAAASDYLRSAAVMATDPAQQAALFTDGWWVWPDSVVSQVEQHGVLTDPDLLAHLRAIAYTGWDIDAVAVHRAMAALQRAGSDRGPR